MAKGNEPGNPESAPVESRRSAAAAEVGAVAPEQDVTDAGEASVLDAPEMGELAAESARPTPLDDIAGAERDKHPRD